MSQLNEVILKNENNQEITLPVICWKGQRIVTLQQVSELHKVPLNNIQKNFRNNQLRFVSGKHYFSFEGKTGRKALLDANKENFSILEKSFGAAIRWARIGLTETGYLLMCKSLTDDLSWSVQEQLINVYYRMKSIEAQDPFTKIHQAIDEIKATMMNQQTPALPQNWIKDVDEDLENVCAESKDLRIALNFQDRKIEKFQSKFNSLSSDVGKIRRNNPEKAQAIKKAISAELESHMAQISELENFRKHIRSTVALIVKDLMQNGCVDIPLKSPSKKSNDVPPKDKQPKLQKEHWSVRNEVYKKYKGELRICKDLAAALGIYTVSGNEHAKFIAKLCRELYFKVGDGFLTKRVAVRSNGKIFTACVLSDEGIDRIVQWWKDNEKTGEVGKDFYGNSCRKYKLGKSIFRVAPKKPKDSVAN